MKGNKGDSADSNELNQLTHAIISLTRVAHEISQSVISLTPVVKDIKGQGNGNGLAASKADLLEVEDRIGQKLEKMAATLDDILKDVTDESTALDSISALISGLQQQLKDALAGVVSPAVQAKVDAIFAGAEANKAKIAAALAANVPPTPPTP